MSRMLKLSGTPHSQISVIFDNLALLRKYRDTDRRTL
jgi:hypothetical protein